MVRILIETGNAAFEDDNKGHEIARILDEIAGKMSSKSKGAFNSKLYDFNGNCVGVIGGDDAVYDDADIQIEFDTGNDAFADGNRNSECARILRDAGKKISRDSSGFDFKLRDLNGNTVGRCSEINKKQKIKPSVA